MREKETERKLVEKVTDAGGLALKFTSPGFDGMPDRLVLIPGGKIGFVEVKAPGRKPQPLQLSRIGMLKRLGFRAFVLNDAGQIGEIISEIQAP